MPAFCVVDPRSIPVGSPLKFILGRWLCFLFSFSFLFLIFFGGACYKNILCNFTNASVIYCCSRQIVVRCLLNVCLVDHRSICRFTIEVYTCQMCFFCCFFLFCSVYCAPLEMHQWYIVLAFKLWLGASLMCDWLITDQSVGAPLKFILGIYAFFSCFFFLLCILWTFRNASVMYCFSRQIVVQWLLDVWLITDRSHSVHHWSLYLADDLGYFLSFFVVGGGGGLLYKYTV